MTDRRRARADERAQRVNTAAELLDAGMPVVQASRALADRYGLSERQARRYVERAHQLGPVPVPVPTVVFTVKLPADLARHIRATAAARGQPISTLVARALAEFLDRADPDAHR
jgi:DNA-binding transcriptional regulator LsrR (DeoR family)